MFNPFDYGAMGDGKTDDTAAFQRTLTSEFGVCVPPGKTFIVNELVLDSMSLWGRGTLRPTKSCAVMLTGDSPTLEGVQIDQGLWRGRENTSVRILEGARNVGIRGCRFSGHTYSAIRADDDVAPQYATSVDGLTISDCLFDGNYVRPILLASVRHVLIQGNRIRDCRYDAIRLRQRVQYCSIVGNHFTNIGTAKTTETQDAVDCCWSGADLLIANNIVVGAGKLGFDIKGDLSNQRPEGDIHTCRVQILGNNISGCEHSAIALSGTSKNLITDILVANNLTHDCCRTGSSADIWVKGGVSRATLANNRGSLKVSGKNEEIVLSGNW